MKIRNKVIVANAGILLFFAIVLISLFPITRSIYVDTQMKEIELELKEKVNEKSDVFEIIKYGSDTGNIVLTPQKQRGLETIRPGEKATIAQFERIDDVSYRVTTNDNRHLIIQVNDRIIAKFMDMIVKILIAAFVILLIIDVVTIYFIMRVIIQPVQKIEEKIQQLVSLDFGKELVVKSHDEFAILADQINRLDLTLSQFISSRQAFATSLAHELKTPVAVIQSAIDLHEHQVGEYANYQYTKTLIEQNITRIEETAKLSLQIFTQKGLFEYKTVDIAELVENYITEWNPLQSKSQLKVNKQLKSLYWSIDQDSFQLILSTIFQNISRYAKNGSEVCITILENKLQFSNVVAEKTTSGTQLGLEVAKTLAEQSHLNIKNYYENECYVVELEKKDTL